MTPPMEPRLAAIAESLQGTRWGAELWDADWRLAWVSDDAKAVLGVCDNEDLGVGRHVIDARFMEPWVSAVDARSREQLTSTELAYIAHDTPGGVDRVRELFEAATGRTAPPVDDVTPPPLWSAMVTMTIPGKPRFSVQYVAARLHGDDGVFLGTAFVYGSTLPARLLGLVTQGNEAMFERMAALVEPARHTAAVLFADLQGSGSLSRRLPSAAYFELVRDLTTAMDRVVLERRGIVGKHAGDGVTAFFLADQFDTASAAAAAAIEAAHEVRSQACAVAEDLSERTGLFEPADCAINVGLHWGGTLYMGQVSTGGRLEVTALGDEVNEGARIQQSARGGAMLASKALIERLTTEDGQRIGVDPEEVVYTTLADLPGADAKSVRDAGNLPVTELFAEEREPASASAPAAAG
jgi:class 3 adenylate cyclase